MAKRFTDSDKWEDPWFRKLSNKGKLLFLYLCDSCDLAGFKERDDEMISFILKCQYEEVEAILNELHKSVEQKDGFLWVKNFLARQKNLPLNAQNPAHKHIIGLLNSQVLRFGFSSLEAKLGALKGLLSPIGIGKDIGKGNKGGMGGNPEKQDHELAPAGKSQGEKWFDELWLRYPNKDGKKHAKRHFESSVKTGEDYARISKALENYLQSKRVREGYVKNASTWFNGWQDWENYTEEVLSGEKSSLERLRELRSKRVS